MNDTEKRLALCFANVFPELSDDQIRRASTASIAAWDSVAHITLLTSIGEEFGIDLDFEEFAEANSFAAVLELVRARSANAGN